MSFCKENYCAVKMLRTKTEGLNLNRRDLSELITVSKLVGADLHISLKL